MIASHRIGVAAWLVAAACLAVFLFDRRETASLVIPPQRCQPVAGEASQWTWNIPESALPLAGGRTPRRDASFLFVDGRLLPIVFPFDVVDEQASLVTGWHEVAQGRLRFRFPAGMERDLLVDDVAIRLELSGPMSTRRQIAFTLMAFAVLFAGLCRTRLSDRAFGVSGLVAIAALAPLALLASLIVSAGATLPLAWRDWTIAVAFDRLDAVLPGWLLLHACVGRYRDRKWASSADDRPSGGSSDSARFVRYGIWAAVAMVTMSFARMTSWGIGSTAAWSPVGISSPFASAHAYSDAEGYLAGAYHLLALGTLDEWNQRRPMNATWLAVRLVAGGWSVDMAKWFQMLATALAIVWATREIALRYGWRAGVAAMAMLVGCGRLFLITTLSEPLGFLLGTFALVAAVRYARTRASHDAMAALALMTLAQGSRPGALFALPAIVLWFAWDKRLFAGRIESPRWRWLAKLVVAAGIVAAMMSINPLLSRIYGTGDNLTGSNFAHTFAALASGQSWAEVVEEYRDELDRQPNERAQAIFLYKEGFRLIGQQPQVFVGEMVRGVIRFAIELPRFLTAITSRSTIDSLLPLLWVQVLAIVGLVATAVWRTAAAAFGTSDGSFGRSDDRRQAWFWIAIGLGWVASVPFVFLDGGLRVLIATWPLALAWLATGLADGSAVQSAVATSSVGRLAVAGRAAGGRYPKGSFALFGVITVVVLVTVCGPAVCRRWVVGPEFFDAELSGSVATPDAEDPESVLANVLANAPANDGLRAMRVDSRMSGPTVWVSDAGSENRRLWRVMTGDEWQRQWQVSGIGLADCFLPQMPTPPFRMEQVFDPDGGRTRILMIGSDVADGEGRRGIDHSPKTTPSSARWVVRLCGEGDIVGRVVSIFSP